MKKIALLFACLISVAVNAQLPPIVTSWVINPGSQTGYNGILSNVQTVQYSNNYVYVSCTCIPGYDIGPWMGNPNVPSNQNFVYKFTRNPQHNTGTLTTVGLGHVGVWTNGVSMFNASDAQSYNNAGVWYRNAYFFEGSSFDSCLGHPQQSGEYHHHVSPNCLYDIADSTHHSPIIGFSFDGYPVYGAYGYGDTMGGGGIKRMKSSYVLRNITARDTLPDGTAASSAGPAINSTYPLGAFMQDYVYTAGSGDLDVRNGRYCVTPEYPNGTYAYFATIDGSLSPQYPYVILGNYYGVITQGNTGPGGGHVTITEATTVYTPLTTVESAPEKLVNFSITPNPVKDYAYIYFDPNSDNNITGHLYDAKGQLLQTFQYMQPSISYALDLSKYPAGNYFLHLETGNTGTVQKIVKVK